MKKISLCDNHSIEYTQINEIEILHIDGKLNMSEIFKKELYNGDHLISLRNAFMHPIPWR